jgi:hypothetical protein
LTTPDERGQSTVELALCLPLAGLVLAVVVEVGLLATDQVRLWHAAREAARAAAVDADPAAPRVAVERAGLPGVELDIMPEPTHRVQGRPVIVSLSYPARPSVPFVGELLPAVELEARAAMRIEQP